MTDRRAVFAVLAITLLVAAAVFVLRPSGAEDEPLEPTSLSAIESAIQAGGTDSLAGLVPTSDAYQAGKAVLDGLKSGVPSNAQILSTAQLDNVKAIARGAVKGAVTESSGITSAADRAALTSLARGYMSGAIGKLAPAPDNARNAVDEAIARGIFAGAFRHVVGPSALIPVAGYETYGRELARDLFGEVHWPSITFLTNSPAIEDIAVFTSELVNEQLSTLPSGVTNAQLTAIAVFAGGGLDGMLLGLVAEFPQGVPAPGEEDLKRYFRGIAHGHEGIPPWTKPESLPALHAWADGLGKSAVEAVGEAHRDAREFKPESTLREIYAVAKGAAIGGYQNLNAIIASSPAIEADVREYANEVSGPALIYILSKNHAPSDPAAIQAYVEGLTHGLAGVTGGSSARAQAFTATYLAGLASAVTDFDYEYAAPDFARPIGAYAKGLTTKLTVRMNQAAATAVHEDDGEVVGEMALAAAQSAVSIGTSGQLADPALYTAFGDGVSRGFLRTLNPADLQGPVNGLAGPAGAWLTGSLAGIEDVKYDVVTGTITDPTNRVLLYGDLVGGDLARWAVIRAGNVSLMGWWAEEDLNWLIEFSNASAGKILQALRDIDANSTVDPAALQDAVLKYGRNVSTAIIQIKKYPYKQEIGHAENFAAFALAPLDWISAPRTPREVKNELRAAYTYLNATVDHADDLGRFTDSEYAAAALTFANGLGQGIVWVDPSGDDPVTIHPDTPTPGTPVVVPWVKGVVKGVLRMKGPLLQDLEGRREWIDAATAAALPVALNVTDDQEKAITDFADAITVWAGSTETSIPHPNDLDKPLLPFAEASIRTGLSKLPPVLSPEEQDAVVSYLFGIVRAVDSLPPWEFTTWPPSDVLVMKPYVEGIASGVPGVVNDTKRLVCDLSNKPLMGHCTDPPECNNGIDDDGDGKVDMSDPDCATPNDDTERPMQCANGIDDDNDGAVDWPADQHCLHSEDDREEADPVPQCRDGIDNDGDGKTDFAEDPECHNNPEGPRESRDAPCKPNDRICMMANYVDNLETWATNLTEPGIEPKPFLTYTLRGSQHVNDWATRTLAAEGYCPGELEDIECHGPRGPVVRFAKAHSKDVGSFAKDSAAPFQHLATLPDIEGDPTQSPLFGPLNAWISGMQQAKDDFHLKTEPLVEEEENGAPVPLPPTSADTAAWKAWHVAMIEAASTAKLQVSWPSTPALEHDFNSLTWLAGYASSTGAAAAIETAQIAQPAVWETVNISLRAWADGVVEGLRPRIVNPALNGSGELMAWYTGVVEGGIVAIGRAAENRTQGEPAHLKRIAERLVAEYAPPLPNLNSSDDSTTPPPTPPPPTGGTGSPPNPENATRLTPEGYLKNMQAHAAGMTQAIVAGPQQPEAGALNAYVFSIAQAAAALPSINPNKNYSHILQTWVEAETAGAIAAFPTGPDRVGTPDRNTAMWAIHYFAATLPWSTVDHAEWKAEWARDAVMALGDLTCPAHLGTAALGHEPCETLGAALGQALGTRLPSELDGYTEPPERNLLLEILRGLTGPCDSPSTCGSGPGNGGGSNPGNGGGEGGLPNPVVPTLGPILEGLVAALVPEASDHPHVEAISSAVSGAILAVNSELPPSVSRPLAEALASALLHADPARYESIADGAVRLVTLMPEQDRENPETVKEEVKEYASAEGDAPPVVSVTDGTRTQAGKELDGTRPLDGLKNLVVRVLPPASATPASTWDLVWSSGSGAGKRLKLVAEEGAFTGTIPANELAGLPRGATVSFSIIETKGAVETRHDREGAPFLVKPDRDAPTATIRSPPTASGPFKVNWAGSDGDSAIKSYRVEARENQRDWTTWLEATEETSADFTGNPGQSYSFRVTATDLVGHTSETSPAATTAIAPTAQANRAPSITFRGPTAGEVFGRNVPISLVVTDPDGSAASVRVCLRKDGASVNLACPFEGSKTTLTLDTKGLADGRYQLHATATDGTLSAEALSGVFGIDRSPPEFRGAIAEGRHDAVLLTAAVDADTRSVVVNAAGKKIPLADNGKDGDVKAGDNIWTGSAALAPGKHELIFTATDANGNEGTVKKTVNVPAPPTLPGSGPTTPGKPSTQGNQTGENGDPNPPTTPPDQPPAEKKKKKGIPGPAAPALVLALAGIALALRRRR